MPFCLPARPSLHLGRSLLQAHGSSVSTVYVANLPYAGEVPGQDHTHTREPRKPPDHTGTRDGPQCSEVQAMVQRRSCEDTEITVKGSAFN